MNYVLPVIIVLCIVLIAAIGLLLYLMSKKNRSDKGDDNNSNNGMIKGLIAAVVLIPLVIIMLVVFSISGNKDNASQNSDNSVSAPVDGNNESKDPAEDVVFEPLSIPQMTYRELKRHNLMIFDWVKTCDKNATGTFILQTKYQHGEDTIREMLLYRNDGAYNVELLPDDETFPDQKGIYFNCVSNEDSDAGYTIAFYSWKEDAENTGDCYVTQAGKVIELADSGWGGKPEVLFPLTINYARKDDMPGKLFDKRTDNIGDNSAVSDLLYTLKCSEFGNYEIKLKTDEEPYRLTVDYSSIDLTMEDYERYETPTLHDYTAVLFALIKNVDEVEWTIDGEQAVLYTREDIDKEYNGNIAAYGESVESFTELWNMIDL